MASCTSQATRTSRGLCCEYGGYQASVSCLTQARSSTTMQQNNNSRGPWTLALVHQYCYREF